MAPSVKCILCLWPAGRLDIDIILGKRVVDCRPPKAINNSTQESRCPGWQASQNTPFDRAADIFPFNFLRSLLLWGKYSRPPLGSAGTTSSSIVDHYNFNFKFLKRRSLPTHSTHFPRYRVFGRARVCLVGWGANGDTGFLR